MYEVKTGLLAVIAAALIILIAGCGFLVFQNHSVKADLLQVKFQKDLAVKELKEYKLNKESSVKNGSALFLKAFLETKPGQKQTTEEKIKPFTSQKAHEQVKIPGQEGKVQNNRITAKIADMKLYYTPIDSGKASILANVTREIAVDNGTPTAAKQLLELQLKLVSGKWIVDDIQVISQ